MAVIYDRDKNSFTHIGVPFNYTRGNPVPIDNSSVWTTKEAAEQYASTNPTAYVGQILTVVDKDSGAVSQWQIADTTGKLESLTSKQNAYVRLHKIKDYLYTADYDNVDYAFAQEYFKKHCQTASGCTIVRNGNYVGRSLDAAFNYLADIVVKVTAADGRRASIGVASQIPGLTNTSIKTDTYNEMFSVVPFFVVDGINDAGVVVGINTTYDAAGKTTGTHAVDASAVTLCALQLPRYVLDNFSTAKAAVDNIKDHVNVYCPHSTELDQEYHLMIADEYETYAVEFENNECIVTKLDKQPWMTNFTISGCTFSDDNTLSYTDSGLRSLARGVERSNIVAKNYASTNSLMGMFQLIDTKLRFTIAYQTTDWPSEFTSATRPIDKAGDLSVFDSAMTNASRDYASRSRDPRSASYGTLQSTHCCVYDIERRKLTISVQETGFSNSLIFSLNPNTKSYRSNIYADAWRVSSTSTDIDNTTLSPNLTDGVFGWKDANGTSLKYADGNWQLTIKTDTFSITGYSAQSELTFTDCPSAGFTTVLLRQESNLDDDRLVTVRMLAGLSGGSGIHATTLAGYGITDAKIDMTSDTTANITLGEKTINVGTKSYVDDLVTTEKTDLTSKLNSKVTVYKTDDESLVITTGDAPTH